MGPWNEWDPPFKGKGRQLTRMETSPKELRLAGKCYEEQAGDRGGITNYKKTTPLIITS